VTCCEKMIGIAELGKNLYERGGTELLIRMVVDRLSLDQTVLATSSNLLIAVKLEDTD
jgi:hypothetical protein